MPAIFAENVANPDLMESIAAEAGVALAPPLYTDALGPPGSPGETYIGMMREQRRRPSSTRSVGIRDSRMIRHLPSRVVLVSRAETLLRPSSR